MNGGGRVKYSVPAAALSKHRRNATGICRQPRHRARQPRYVEARNTPIGISPLDNKGISTSHVSASRPDLHGNRRLSGESLRQRHQGHRLAVQVGPRCGHDTWELIVHRWVPARAGRRVSTTGCQPSTARAHRPGGSPLRPLARLRSLPSEPMRAPAASRQAPTRLPQTRCGSSRAKPVPCLTWLTRSAGGLLTTGSTEERRVDDSRTCVVYCAYCHTMVNGSHWGAVEVAVT